MSVAQTKAAEIMQEQAEQLSSHQVISLLLEGALERIAQAKQCAKEGNEEDKEILVTKLVGIIDGLRASLNLDEGGEIALNLANLYDYMIARLDEQEKVNEEALQEVGKLIGEVKGGWDAIEGAALEEQPEAPQSA